MEPIVDNCCRSYRMVTVLCVIFAEGSAGTDSRLIELSDSDSSLDEMLREGTKQTIAKTPRSHAGSSCVNVCCTFIIRIKTKLMY